MHVWSSKTGDINVGWLSPSGIGQVNSLGFQTLIPISATSLSLTGSLNESVSNALTAGTTHTLAGATVLPSQTNIISVCATSADAVALPLASAAQLGNKIIVQNNGVAAAAVWPQAADKIDGGSAGAAVTLTNGKAAMFICNAAGNWVSLGFPTRSA